MLENSFVMYRAVQRLGFVLLGFTLSIGVACGASGPTPAAEHGPSSRPASHPTDDDVEEDDDADGSAAQHSDESEPTDVTAQGSGTAPAPPVAAPVQAPKPVLEDCTKDVDIVFVLDVSGSMAPFFLMLEEEIFVVDSALRALSLPSSPHYGLVVFVDDTMLHQEGKPLSEPAAIRDAFVWGIGLAGLGQIENPAEFNGTFVENSLDALQLAAESFQWRAADKTHRMIIHVTDDTFWDGPTSTPGLCDDVPLNRTGCRTKGSVHSYDEVVQTLREQNLWTFAFAAKGRLLAAGLVDTQAGFFTPHKGRNTVPALTGGSSWDIFSVLDGSVSLSASINKAVIETQCETYPPVPPPPPDPAPEIYL